MKVVLDRREEVAAWVAERLDISTFNEPYQAIGFEDEAGLCGGHVYENMTEFDVHVHVAGRGALTRAACRIFWNYVFVQNGCLRATAVVRSNHHRMISIDERLGFKREGLCRKHFGDCDAIIFGMLADDAPAWMRPR
jgi:RimJ/RimL family protein N-acetyltransferase